MKADLHRISAVELARAIRGRQVSAVEALQHFQDRYRRFNASINALVCVDFDGAAEIARHADRELEAGRLIGPLHGVPMTMKESFNVAGFETTWGLPENVGWMPERDGISAQRFRAAGAVIFGKSNVAQGLLDLDSFNEVYGVTNNPYDLACIPGGSSGGAAAALAAGLTAVEVGSDSASSIRYPAHYCGVYGHKSTFGIVPMRGEGVRAQTGYDDISVVGPMARFAEDLALALSVQAGADDNEAAGWQLQLRKPNERSLRDFRIAIMATHHIAPVSRQIHDRIGGLAKFLSDAGATVHNEAKPDFDFDEAYELFVLLLASGRGPGLDESGLREMNEIARGQKGENESYFQTKARGVSMSHRDWLLLNRQRQKLKQKWAEFFRSYDFFICPVAITPAFPHIFEGKWHQRRVQVDGQSRGLAEQIFWAGPASLSCLPATSIPIGFTDTGLPIGAQVIGPRYGDYDCIAFAELLGRAYGGFVPPPMFP